MYSLGRHWPLSGIRQHSTRRMLSMLVLGSRKYESEDKRPDDFGHCKSAAIDKMKNIPPS